MAMLTTVVAKCSNEVRELLSPELRLLRLITSGLDIIYYCMLLTYPSHTRERANTYSVIGEDYITDLLAECINQSGLSIIRAKETESLCQKSLNSLGLGYSSLSIVNR